ncbi:MAG: KpsF/GutQ family sugar-phosphate isomerase [Nitrospiraceae bacterium]|nr:KpsF/GutQ family sugar-phosphate isomerase [Nitrospiraceae bacterium]
MKDNLLREAERVLKVEAGALLALIDGLDEGFLKTVRLIDECKGRVIVTGMGKSGLVGKKIAATFSSVGVPSFFLHPAEAIHGDLGMVTKHDVVLAISNSGETDELVAILPHLKRFNVQLAVMSGNCNSTLCRAADTMINIGVKEEACPLGIVPTASTTAALAMGDALAVVLIKKRGFMEEDFASFHPGGSLGKKLLVTVKDLMIGGGRIPCVSPATPMSGVILEMSSKRLGMTLVAEGPDEKTVAGVITDGDLRRAIEHYGKELFDMKAGEIMNRSPKVISADELAAKALAIMEEHSITTLAVLDNNGQAAGIIHIHDILKKGIA